MYKEYLFSNSFGVHPALSSTFSTFFGLFLVPLVAWSLIWKGWALWKAAKNNSVPWFIALLVVNTMGLLEILYIFIFSRSKSEVTPKSSSKKRK